MSTSRKRPPGPPPVGFRPQCPGCGKSVQPVMACGSVKVEQAPPDIGFVCGKRNRHWTGQCHACGRFCALRCATACANCMFGKHRPCWKTRTRENDMWQRFSWTLALWLLVAGAILVIVTPAGAGVKKCVSPDGAVTYSDVSCPASGKSEQVEIHHTRGFTGLRQSERHELDRVRRKERGGKRPKDWTQPRKQGTREHCYGSRKTFHRAMNDAHQRGILAGSSGTCVRTR